MSSALGASTNFDERVYVGSDSVPALMHALGVAMGALGILVGGFWLVLSLAHRSRWARNFVQWGDVQARARRDEGYKVNVAAFYAWVARTPLRAATHGLMLIAFGVWFVSLSR